jgi:uncharacterized protein
MEKIQFFSDKTNTFYQLVPTETIPVLKINGVPMHRYATIDPLTDVKLKIRAINPKGKVLDICTGLGYSSIYSAKLNKVSEVVTIEKDEEVLKLAKLSQDSKDLFTNEKIKIINKDAAKAVKDFQEGSFDCIMHDPPTFVIAPELYTLDFYKDIYRILKRGGKLAHYAPSPGKAKDKNIAKRFISRIITNLKNAGFKKIRHFERETEIIAVK